MNPTVEHRDDAQGWRWAPEQAVTTAALIAAAVQVIRETGEVSQAHIWGLTGITNAQQRRYFPTVEDLLAEIRGRVVADVLHDAAIDRATLQLRRLTVPLVADQLLRLAVADHNLWQALQPVDLVGHALAGVAVVANTSRTFYRASVHVDTLYRRAAAVAVVRATIDEALRQLTDAPDGTVMHHADVVRAIAAFVASITQATA